MTELRDRARLTPEQTFADCDPAWLAFETTDALPVLEAVFGQERAVRAIEFALGMEAPGYNLFASGPDGFGKQTVVTTFLRRRAQSAPAPLDWVYVHNFTDADHPQAIGLAPGQGPRFAQAVADAVRAAQREIRAAFDSDSYARRRQELADQLDRRRTEILEGLQGTAQQAGFALQFGPTGILSAPLIEGRPATEEQFAALPEAERETILERRRTLEKDVQETLLRIRALERNAVEEATRVDEEVAAFAIDHLFRPLQEQFGQDVEVQQYLEALRDEIERDRDRFRAEEGAAQPLAGLTGAVQATSLRRYEVNAVVTNDPQQGAPVIVETHPIYPNLIGRIDYEGQFGAMVTDHTMIRAGSLARANGGYIVIRLRDILQSQQSLDGLKRALSSGLLTIENLAEMYGVTSSVGLRPEPIPLSVKVVIVGDSYLYGLLYRYDPDFRELFRVKADFETDFARTKENAAGLASVIRAECQRAGLRPFRRDAVERLIEHSSRMVEDQRRLSGNMAAFLDIVRQAEYWARFDGASIVERWHVERALEEEVYRSALFRDRLIEAMQDGSIRVETEGEQIGQINALSVYDLGDISFGRPSRVTCVVSPGRGTIVMVERDSDMAGRIHNKGFLILRGFLAHRFGQDRASSLHASLAFEQLYGDIDGDSASSTELYVLLSALAGLPVRQHIAVTGSVDQLGRVQPIGGATQKTEGFFDICSTRGLDGTQGVMIPRSNVPNLNLRPDVVRAIRDGKFHIWAIDTIEEGLEILTGVPAGMERGTDGKYAEGTVYRMVEDRLAEFAAALSDRPAAPESARIAMTPAAAPIPPGIPPGPPPQPPVIVTPES